MRAALVSAVFLVVAPGTMTVLVPWLVTGFEVEEPGEYWAPLRVLGAVLIAAGVPVLIHSFARFVIEGFGTPAPTAPPTRLVVGGFFRYVRNPMYVAIGSTIAGEGFLFGQPILFAWAALFLAVVSTFVRIYEEPQLARQFGAEYDEYRRAVPGWWPRLRPWRPAR